MILSNRLQEVVNLVPKCSVVADIGCDHAHVAISIIENGIADKVVACDVNRGPLEMAKKNVYEAGLADRIELRLSDGLSALETGEADCIIIAGMGGKLMRRIIETKFDKIRDNSYMVLQPQSDVPQFRSFLLQNGFRIEKECMIFEDGKFYPMMRVVKGFVKEDDASLLGQEWDELELEYGKGLLDSLDSVLYEYLDKERKQLKAIILELEMQGTADRSQQRIAQIGHKIALNTRALERFV